MTEKRRKLSPASQKEAAGIRRAFSTFAVSLGLLGQVTPVMAQGLAPVPTQMLLTPAPKLATVPPEGSSTAPSTPSTPAVDSAQKAITPGGTMLLPLTPKLDTKPEQTVNETIEEDVNLLPTGEKAPTPVKSAGASKEDDALMADDFATEKARVDELDDDTKIGDDTTLKGTVQIVADDTEYDQENNTFLGTGNAVALINGQASKLEADMILYDQTSQMMDARGNVRIYRAGQITTGSSFKFKVTSDEYLITNPDTELNGSEVIARHAYGSKTGVLFTNGNLTMPTPIYMQRNVMWGPISYRDVSAQKQKHPDAFSTAKPSFRFKARKMVYEKYKEQGNLTIFGGRIECGNFTIPLGKLTATAGKQETKVTMPITPMISNNLMVGGLNIGPKFNYGVGKNGVLSWAPLVQFGGSQAVAGNTTSNPIRNGIGGSAVGLGAQFAYTNQILTSHLAYGQVSNLLVGDFKLKVYKKTKYQFGINRYLDDGMFGFTRARVQSEFVDNHPVKVPYLASVNFRTSAGWAQDNPQLIDQTSTQNQKLYSGASSNKITSAFRVQEQLTATTHPIFNVGDDRYGLKSYIYGGVGLRGYSTGDKMILGQLGPVLDAHLNKVRLQAGYTQSAVKGQSPFVFDEFIQGSSSVYLNGDVKLTKYVQLGGTIGYNLTSKLPYQQLVTVAIGPEDWKLLLSRNFLQGTNRFGFDVLYGQPVPFDKLVMKGGPDQGQLGAGVH